MAQFRHFVVALQLPVCPIMDDRVPEMLTLLNGTGAATAWCRFYVGPTASTPAAAPTSCHSSAWIPAVRTG
jgi:hypothetical protein